KRYLDSPVTLGPDGLLPKTGLAPISSAPFVLMPGDPGRSKTIAGFFRDSSFTAHRGTFATYTGHTENGTPIAVTSSGMGASCVATALEELADAGAKAVVRVGTCGALQPDIFPGQIVIASGCVRGEGASYELVPEEFPAVPDPLLTSAIIEAAREMGEPVKAGLYRSHDAFYMESKAAHPGLRGRMEQWIQSGVQVVENESGTLFPYGYLLGLRTGCICVAASNMFLTAEEQGENPYGDPSAPDFMPRRIERASRIAMRAAELLQEGLK
ncbi:MAG: nucleoside phosphorylase, partial [Oscillospiraceae bacterium]|nr:nucleoside phosphorylase [Oscillospiraceae bacterium]